MFVWKMNNIFSSFNFLSLVITQFTLLLAPMYMGERLFVKINLVHLNICFIYFLFCFLITEEKLDICI